MKRSFWKVQAENGDPRRAEFTLHERENADDWVTTRCLGTAYGEETAERILEALRASATTDGRQHTPEMDGPETEVAPECRLCHQPMPPDDCADGTHDECWARTRS